MRLARPDPEPDVARRNGGRHRPRRRRRDRRDRGHRAPPRREASTRRAPQPTGIDRARTGGHRHDAHHRRRLRAARVPRGHRRRLLPGARLHGDRGRPRVARRGARSRAAGGERRPLVRGEAREAKPARSALRRVMRRGGSCNRPVLAGVAYAARPGRRRGVGAVREAWLSADDGRGRVRPRLLPPRRHVARRRPSRSPKRIEAELAATPEVRHLHAPYRRGARPGGGDGAEPRRHHGPPRAEGAAIAQRRTTSSPTCAGRVERSLPEVRVEFVQVLQDVLNDLSGSPRPIEVKLLGPDYAEARRDRCRDWPQKLQPGARPRRPLRRPRARHPRAALVADRDAIARLGTTPDDVDAQLETALLGAQVGSLRRFDRLVGVRVRYPDPGPLRPRATCWTCPSSPGARVTTFAAVSTPRREPRHRCGCTRRSQPMVDVTADSRGPRPRLRLGRRRGDRRQHSPAAGLPRRARRADRGRAGDPAGPPDRWRRRRCSSCSRCSPASSDGLRLAALVTGLRPGGHRGRVARPAGRPERRSMRRR